MQSSALNLVIWVLNLNALKKVLLFQSSLLCSISIWRETLLGSKPSGPIDTRIHLNWRLSYCLKILPDREWQAKGQKEFSVALNSLRNPGQAVRRRPLKRRHTTLLFSWAAGITAVSQMAFAFTLLHNKELLKPHYCISCLVVTCFCILPEIQNIRSSVCILKLS